MKHILVVEDDFNIQELLQNFLEADGYKVTLANDGVEAISLFLKNQFDLILLDLLLPKIDGYTVCELIRKESMVPIVILTALDEEEKQIKGFKLQADDYITKPFSMQILLYKIAAVLRRTSKLQPKQTLWQNSQSEQIPQPEQALWQNPQSGQILQTEQALYQTQELHQSKNLVYEDLVLDINSYEVFQSGRSIELTQREFQLLKMLLSHQGQVLTRQLLLESIWGYDFYGDERVVDTHIKNIRKKLNKDYIKTVRGVGYRVDKKNKK